MNLEIIVRKARVEDAVDIMEMIKELAAFENLSDGPKITHKDLIRDGFTTEPPLFICFVAEEKSSGRLVGMILGNYAYSSWTGFAAYIEDIYVRGEWRGKAVGHMLMTEFCKHVYSKGCTRLDWHVLRTNAKAIRFYERHGAYCLEDVDDRRMMRIDQDQIQKLATS